MIFDSTVRLQLIVPFVSNLLSLCNKHPKCTTPVIANTVFEQHEHAKVNF